MQCSPQAAKEKDSLPVLSGLLVVHGFQLQVIFLLHLIAVSIIITGVIVLGFSSRSGSLPVLQKVQPCEEFARCRDCPGSGKVFFWKQGSVWSWDGHITTGGCRLLVFRSACTKIRQTVHPYQARQAVPDQASRKFTTHTHRQQPPGGKQCLWDSSGSYPSTLSWGGGIPPHSFSFSLVLFHLGRIIILVFGLFDFSLGGDHSRGAPAPEMGSPSPFPFEMSLGTPSSLFSFHHAFIGVRVGVDESERFLFFCNFLSFSRE